MKKFLVTTAILLVIVVVFGAAMYALNLYTGPIIEKNSAGAASERLNAVMPDGAAFEDITATLTLPEKLIGSDNPNRTADIVAVHKETNGLGWVVEVSWTSEDSHGTNLLLVGISADGKIVKVNNEAYTDTDQYNIFKKDPTFVTTFEGQDSTLAGVPICVAGSTHSSKAFKSAVGYAFEVLVLNDMVQAGVKSDDQILTEMITTVAPVFSSLKDAKVSGNIEKGFKSASDTGFAYIIKNGDATYLAIVNAMGACKVYDVEGKDVTSAQASVASEAQAQAKTEQTKYETSFNKKIGKLMEGAENFTALQLDTFNTIAYAASFEVEGTTYYAFYSRAYGFEQMDIYFIIDENGAIVKMDAATLIFEEEYFNGFAGVPGDYKDGFAGFTADTWTDDTAIIAGATRTSNAMKQATNDAFACFATIK